MIIYCEGYLEYLGPSQHPAYETRPLGRGLPDGKTDFDAGLHLQSCRAAGEFKAMFRREGYGSQRLRIIVVEAEIHGEWLGECD